MSLRRLLFIAGALLLALALSMPALAGGWSTINLDALPSGVAAGQETTIGLTVLQHGVTPRAGATVTLTFRDAGGGDAIVVPALEAGPVGHYIARVTLPRSGAWEWSVRAIATAGAPGPLLIEMADHPMPSLAVAAAAAPPSQVTPSAHLAIPDWAFATMLATLAIATLSAFGLGWHRRKQPTLAPR